MRIELTNGQIGEQVTKRAFYLAWRACRGPLGMGVFQDKPDATEEDVWANIHIAGDYLSTSFASKPGEAYGDYVFGRMMKLNIRYGDDYVVVPDGGPRLDYQAWSPKYPTYDALIKASIESLAVNPETVT